MDGRDYLAGTGVNGYSVCANVGAYWPFAQYVPNIGSGDFRRSPMIQGAVI